jgi:hypothetical protein
VLDGGGQRKLLGMIGLHDIDVFFVLDFRLRRRFGFGITFRLAAPRKQQRESPSRSRYFNAQASH